MQIGIAAEVHPARTEELVDPNRTPVQNAEALARQKARRVEQLVAPGSVVIAADTIVVSAGRYLGKPKDSSEARAMIVHLSGREHLVTTGVCVLIATAGTQWTGHQSTHVRMRHIPEPEIDAYVRTGEPMDKAGAYGIQGRGALFVEEIRGDYSNVVGLPLLLTARLVSQALGLSDLEFLLDTT